MGNERNEILFLGGIYPEQLYNGLTALKMNKNVQFAADVLQKHIIKGLDAVTSKPVKIINAPFIGAFPRGSSIVRFKSSSFEHCSGASDINICFWNIPLLRHFSIYLSSRREIKKWIKNHERGTVIAYSLTLRNVWRLLYAKRLSKDVETCMIVTDLPLYMRLSAGNLYQIAKKVENWLIFRKLHKIDSFVLLTEQMNDVIRSNNYCVVEGIATNNELPSIPNDEFRVVLYSGTLDKKYGIINLLEAFHGISGHDLRLYICGTGDSQDAVEEMARIDNRICYYGLVSREIALRLQSAATVLVNPRQNIETFTKYSFPSKNLEYLSSGVPLVAYKLDGIPDDYDPYIHYVHDDTVESLREEIERVLNYSTRERRTLGKNARNFVLKNKNERIQAQRILDMLNCK